MNYKDKWPGKYERGQRIGKEILDIVDDWSPEEIRALADQYTQDIQRLSAHLNSEDLSEKKRDTLEHITATYEGVLSCLSYYLGEE